ncbi:MAG: ParM/StbA family protein [Richelia sp. RM2_1_2]|nr:ParM/StbA family protein [Richelia sp. RM2_1_2]
MGRLNKQAYPEVTLTIDFGGSGTKGIVQIRGGKPTAFWMEASVIEAPYTSLAFQTRNLGNAYPENTAWVGIGEDYRAVGYLARSIYSATPRLKPRKYELALYKTLAAIWVIKQKFKLSGSFDISLALLLPPGEFEDSALLKPMLKEALTQFDTPTNKINANLVGYECFPESGGIYAMYCKNTGEAIRRKVIALVMLGYRNASVIISRRGILNRGKTAKLGMTKMVDLVIEGTSGLEAEELIEAIVAAGDEPKAQHFYHLCSSNSTKDAQVEKIISVVNSSRAEYSIALMSWLTEVLPNKNELDEVIICGGTADYLREELDSVFPTTPIVWHGGVEVPQTLNEQWLGNRLADVWALSVYHGIKVRAGRRRGTAGEGESEGMSKNQYE